MSDQGLSIHRGALPAFAPLPPGGAYGQGLPTLPISKPTTDVGKHAQQKRGLALDAAARVREAADIARQVSRDLGEAREALRVEIERAGREGNRDAEKEAQLLRRLADCELMADPSITETRGRAALNAQRAAIDAFKGYVGSHIQELVDGEFAPLAEQVAADLAEAETNPKATVGQLRAAQAAYGDFCLRIAGLKPYVRNPELFELPASPFVPLPPIECYSALELVVANETPTLVGPAQ